MRDPMMSNATRMNLWLAVSVLIALVPLGCSTHNDFLQQPRDLFYKNQLPQAEKEFSSLQKKRREADVVELDLAMIDLVQGKPKEAEKRLQTIRDRFDQLEQQTIASGVM
ncbi:MAG: hypothetical protein ACK55I_02890, partial [bacterium]